MSTETISLKDFLSEFSDELRDRVKDEMKPLYDPKNRDALDIKRSTRLSELKRRLFSAQEDAVLAVAKGFQVSKGGILCGEMGTGKTIMALAVAYLLDVKRVLVMCPGHLVQKWIREAKDTIPGCTVVNLNGKSMAELVNLRKNRTKPKNMEVWVIGKERAKLHYQTTGVIAQYGKGKAFYDRNCAIHNGYCPRCGREIEFDTLENVRKNKKAKCSNVIRTNDDGTEVLCGEPLYQSGGRFRRYAKAEYIKRYLKGAFDFFVADEVHELKGGNTGQGQAFADLATSCKRTLALTGTLMGGYSTNLYFILWRLTPKKMLNKNMDYGKTMQFAKLYGVMEYVFVEDSHYNVASIGGRRRLVSTREKPGISPLILTDMLLENTVFVRLADISKDLPPFNEIIVPVEMDAVQKQEYKDFEDTLMSAVQEALARGDKRLLGKMINSLLAYPDGCRRPECITLMNDNGVNEIIAEAPALDFDILPKEQELVEIVQQELGQGRKCLVCLEHTGTRDLIPEIETCLTREGVKPLVLRSTTVSTEKREEWVKKKMESGDYNVLITNPRLIQTGLDLLEFPSIVFFQTGYSIFTLRQSSRRSWRIGQDRNVNVYYMSYAKTAQEKALTLIASKLETSMAVEGDLSDKGLAALSNSESSMLFALARELLDHRQHGSGASLQEAWNKYKKQEVESDSCLDDPETTETVTTTYTKGDHTASVQYQQVVRGMVYAQKTIGGEFIGVAHVDGKHEFIFFKGDIYYRKKKVGSYDKKHGELNGKPIRLTEVSGKNQYVLYELKAA